MSSISKAWKFGHDVDTDQIIASQYIILPSIEEMAPHTFETVDESFAASVKAGDIVVGGDNFGCGSSREQAPAVLRALGVRAVVAKSFARIFFRNAINIGLPVVICPDVYDAVQTGSELALDLEAGTLTLSGKTYSGTRLPSHMQDILSAGGLIAALNADDAAQKPHDSSEDAPCPMTMAEKIIALAAGRSCVKAGEIVTVAPDLMMSNDGTTHLTIGAYETKLKAPRVAHNEKMVFVVDHNCPSDSPKTAAAHKKMRDFAKKENIAYYEGQGVCHQLMAENHVCPGQFIIGADSHTCTYGALGAFGTGVGGTDFLYGMVTGTTWVLVPETLRFELVGSLKEGVSARDLMLQIIGDIGADGATYKVMEFVGEGLLNMSVNERLVLSNLAVEAGAKTALMPPDDKVCEYITALGRSPKALLHSDEGATYAKTFRYELSDIVPVVARPHRIDDVVPAKDAVGTKIDEAFLGSCNSGRIEELRTAAEILKGKKVHPSVRFIVSPASNEVFAQAAAEGVIAQLSEAGAMVVNPNCSVCWGSCQGVLGDGEVLISTGTRNFKGRAGHLGSFVYLGSAATVTASAIMGEITTADML